MPSWRYQDRKLDYWLTSHARLRLEGRSLRHFLSAAVTLVLLVGPNVAFAQRYQDPRREPPLRQPVTTGSLFGLTPPVPYEYDTGGDNDRHPELAPSQRGGGQQTGGPARNLIPGDGLHISPR